MANSPTTTFLNPKCEIKNDQYTIVNLTGLSKPNAQPSNKGPQPKNNTPGNMINFKKTYKEKSNIKYARLDKKWSAQSYPGCPIIQRSSKDVTYTQINTGDQTNIETSEPTKSSTPTCIKPVINTQNNQYTFAQLPRLVTTHAQQSVKGTLGRTNNKKPGTKLTPKQKPA